MERSIDDEHFPELVGQIAAFAQEIDQMADGHMFGHRDEIAAHQAASGFFRVRQRGFDRGAVFGLHFGEDGLLVFLVQILQHRHRVIGVELFGDIGHFARG